MRVVPNIPLIWAKSIRDAGMTKNQAKKILEESEVNSRLTQNSVSTQEQPETSKAQRAAEQKLNIV